jgi:RimJ/RimL family protein N-acetyltransferase/uncharacterized damage-inducible protein DinB
MALRTTHLLLIPADADLVRADLIGPAALSGALHHQVPASWPPEHYDVPAMEYSLALLEREPAAGAWTFHYIIASDGRAAGISGFKGPPTADGTVEVGYSILPEYQRRGFATEAVSALVDQAFTAPGVFRIVAETLPSLLPSIRVLEKNGFRPVGPGAEPGVIRFELTRADFIAGRRQIPGHLRHFITLLAHQSWADLHALDALERADPPDTAALALLGHIIGAEHVWLARLQGVKPRVEVWPEASPDECRRLGQENELGYREFIFGLAPSDLRRLVRYTNTAGLEFLTSVEDILLHLFLHGAYHRGQVALRLRLGGQRPEPTDYIGFARGAPAATRRAQ